MYSVYSASPLVSLSLLARRSIDLRQLIFLNLV